MEWEFVAPMVVSIVLFLTIGGVLILRPLSKRLAELLEVMTRNREQPRLQEESIRLHEQLETLSERLSLVEERQDFSDQLLQERDRPRKRLQAVDEEGA